MAFLRFYSPYCVVTSFDLSCPCLGGCFHRSLNVYDAVEIHISEKHFLRYSHRQGDAAVAEVIQDGSKRIAVSIDEDGLGRVLLPRVGHEASEHGILMLQDEGTSSFEDFAADVERDRRGDLGIIHHGFNRTRDKIMSI